MAGVVASHGGPDWVRVPAHLQPIAGGGVIVFATVTEMTIEAAPAN